MFSLCIPRRQAVVPLHGARYTFTTGVHGDERGTVTVSRNHTLHLRGTDVGDRVVVVNHAGVQVWAGFIAGVTSEADGARTYDLIGLWQAIANIPITFRREATIRDFRVVQRGDYSFGAVNIRPERYEVRDFRITLRQGETYDADNGIAFWFDFPDKYLKVSNYEFMAFFPSTGLFTNWNKRIATITNGVETVLYTGTGITFLTTTTPFDAIYILLWPPATVVETTTGASTINVVCNVYLPTTLAYLDPAFRTLYAPFVRLDAESLAYATTLFGSLDDAPFAEHLQHGNTRLYIQRQTATLIETTIPPPYRNRWRTNRATIARNWSSVPTYVYSRWTDETNRVRRTPDATVSTMLTNREYVVRSLAPDGQDEAKAIANRDTVVSASLTPPPVVTVTLPLRGRGLATTAGAQVPAYLAEPGDELLISEAYAKGEIVSREISNGGVRYDVSIKQTSALDVFAR